MKRLLELLGSHTESSALCRGVAGSVEVAPGGVTRVIRELDNGEHVEESLHPVFGLGTDLVSLLVSPDPGDIQEEDKNNWWKN